MVRVVLLVLLRLVVLVLVLVMGVHESRHRDGWKGDQHPGNIRRRRRRGGWLSL